MSSEAFSQLTDNEKFWYLRGYLESMVESIAIDMGVSKEIVTIWLVDRLRPVVGL